MCTKSRSIVYRPLRAFKRAEMRYHLHTSIVSGSGLVRDLHSSVRKKVIRVHW
jgi:hypothetical protein